MEKLRSIGLIGVLCLCLMTVGLSRAAESVYPVRLAVIGDRTGGHVPGIYGQVVREVGRLHPDLILTVGDQIEGYTDNTETLQSEWDEYFELIEPFEVPIYLTPGNHDILSDIQENVYRERVGEPHYSFDYGDIHFVILDNGRWEKSDELPSGQVDWLINDLDHSRHCRHKIVFMHKPYWANSTAIGQPDTLHSLFVAYDVDAVFTGHYHEYFSGEYDGIIYTGVGSSGGSTEPGPTGLMYHFCWVTVSEDDIAIAPIKFNSVLPWDEMTVDEKHLAGRIKKLCFEFSPLLLGDDLKPVQNRFALKINNLSPDRPIDDTLTWTVPKNWSIDPSNKPVAVAPGHTGLVEFEVACRGSIYPLPTAELEVAFAEGKEVSISENLRVARSVGCRSVMMPPVIDGNIAEPIWNDPVKRFFAPDGSKMQTDPARFYFTYDEDRLYIAARCGENNMDSLAAKVFEHDGPVYTEDCIGFFLQPDKDNDIVYQFYINPFGYVFDQKLSRNEVSGYMDADRDWDGRYDIKTILGPDSWTVEVAVPLDQFGVSGYPRKEMGLNFRRKQARLGTSADWQVPIDYDPRTLGILIME